MAYWEIILQPPKILAWAEKKESDSLNNKVTKDWKIRENPLFERTINDICQFSPFYNRHMNHGHGVFKYISNLHLL